MEAKRNPFHFLSARKDRLKELTILIEEQELGIEKLRKKMKQVVEGKGRKSQKT